MSELRPSFQERDRYLDLLSTAYADGRLDESEFEARSNAVLAAVTHRDAMAQFQGLPQPNIVPVTPTYPRPNLARHRHSSPCRRSIAARRREASDAGLCSASGRPS